MLFAPRWVIWVVASGLFTLVVAVLILVWTLDVRVTAEALAHHGMYVERRLEETTQEVAAEEFGAGGGGLSVFSKRMVTVARHSPAVRELVVVGPDRKVVRRFGAEESRACLAALPPGVRRISEHEAGEIGADPIGCLVLPVHVAGAQAAAVYLHVTRDWAEGGTLVKNAVRRTALQLAPVFAVFYLLLGGLLVLATRAAHRWRRKAIQAERVEALGAMASGINHEIKNPLNALGLCLQVLKRRHRDDESRETLAMADQQAQQIVGTLDDFARFARVADLRLENAEVGERIRARAEARGWSIEQSGTARVRIDTTKMDDALDAILDLLVRHRTEDGTVRVGMSASKRQWNLNASVHAPGFDGDRLAHLFDPYVRTRPRDIGRGLAWARAVFQAHEGDVSAHYTDERLEIRAHAAPSPGE